MNELLYSVSKMIIEARVESAGNQESFWIAHECVVLGALTVYLLCEWYAWKSWAEMWIRLSIVFSLSTTWSCYTFESSSWCILRSHMGRSELLFRSLGSATLQLGIHYSTVKLYTWSDKSYYRSHTCQFQRKERVECLICACSWLSEIWSLM